MKKDKKRKEQPSASQTEGQHSQQKEILRDVTGTLLEVWQRFYPELSEAEKQLILKASDLSMPEQQIKEMFNLPVEEMKEKISQFELSKIRAASS